MRVKVPELGRCVCACVCVRASVRACMRASEGECVNMCGYIYYCCIVSLCVCVPGLCVGIYISQN